MDESSRMSTLSGNTKDGDEKSDDESGAGSSSEEEKQEKKDEVPKVKDKKEATEIFKELLKDKVRQCVYHN
jgi:hypothetical protein